MSETYLQPLSSDINRNYNFKIIVEEQKEIGNALVQSKQDGQGRYWHLENIFILQEYRSQGYGTILLNNIREYLWNVARLRIRVHPAVGQQTFEDFAKKYQEINSQADPKHIEYLDKLSVEEWLEYIKNHPSEIIEFDSDSTYLITWYKNRGFTIEDPDKKHLWCDPESYNPSDLESGSRIIADLGARGKITVNTVPEE